MSDYSDIFLSVIIPTYKEASCLPKTPEEILPYLRRNFAGFEILIVDGPGRRRHG
jgi:glycosyltransferase involved in cell wall biosynthesis